MRLQIETRIGSLPVQQIVEVNTQELVIGRRARWMGQSDEFISQEHAKIVTDENGTLRLIDLSSRNGTFVNGEQVTQVTLHVGDLIRCGHTILRVLETGAPSQVVVTQWPALFTCHQPQTQRQFRRQF